MLDTRATPRVVRANPQGNNFRNMKSSEFFFLAHVVCVTLMCVRMCGREHGEAEAEGEGEGEGEGKIKLLIMNQLTAEVKKNSSVRPPPQTTNKAQGGKRRREGARGATRGDAAQEGSPKKRKTGLIK